MIKKLEPILPVFIPLLILFSYICLALDTFIYPGAVAKYLLIDSRFYFGLSLVLVLFFVPSKKDRDSNKFNFYDFTMSANAVSLTPLWIIYLIFVGVEAGHFTNYVLSTYHIHLDGLVSLPIFGLSLFLTEKIKNAWTKTTSVKKGNLIYLVLVLLIAYSLVRNLASSFNTAVEGNLYVFLHLRSSYDEKMYYQWGDFYRYMVFIKNNTPENAKIVIPPEQEPWVARTGDMQLVRAFLFPRELIQYNKITIPDLQSLEPGTYIMVSWGDRSCSVQDCHGWPKQTIIAKKIFYKDPNSSDVIETKENFVYEKDDYKYVYGLIKL